MAHPIGIDLGTTFSSIAKWVSKVSFTGSKAYHMPTEGTHSMPSKVFIEIDEDTGERDFVFGKTAQAKGTSKPDQFIKAVKRQVDDADFRYQVAGEEYSPIDISSEIIRVLLKIVDGVEGPGTYVPSGIVVSVPYYFKQHQNLNTSNAALKAINKLYGGRKGVTVPDNLFLGLIAEPIAAGLDYAFNRDAIVEKENILVFDLGGGTFDLTIFSLEQQERKIKFEVLAVDGNDRLGGEDFDNSLFKWVCEHENIDLDAMDEKSRTNALKRIQPMITEIVHDFSSAKRVDIHVPHAYGAEHIEIEGVKRSDFEDCITGKAGDRRDYYGEIEFKLERILDKANVSPEDISCVLAVGGASQIVKFKELISLKFGETKLKSANDINLAVAKGATIYSAYLLDEYRVSRGKPRKHLDKWDEIEIGIVTPHQLGIELNGRFFKIIEDNALTPHSMTRIFEPSRVSPDGEMAVLEKLVILQGEPADYSVVGDIELDDIYTHGRSLSNISIPITFTAIDSSLVKIRVFVEKGNADKSDYVVERDVMLSQ